MRKLFYISILLAFVAAWAGCGDSSHTLTPTSQLLFIRAAGSTGSAASLHAVERGRLNVSRQRRAQAIGKPFVIAGGTDSVVMMKNDGTGQIVLTSQGGETGTFGAVQFSLDGKMAVGTAMDDKGYLQIFIVKMSNLKNLQPVQITSDTEHHYVPQLSPDNKTVIFVKYNETLGKGQAYTVKASGGAETLISTPNIDVNYPSYTPDGKNIVFEEEEHDAISIMSTSGTGVKTLTNADGAYNDEFPSVSPDGKTTSSAAMKRVQNLSERTSIPSRSTVPARNNGPPTDLATTPGIRSWSMTRSCSCRTVTSTA